MGWEGKGRMEKLEGGRKKRGGSGQDVRGYFVAYPVFLVALVGSISSLATVSSIRHVLRRLSVLATT